MKREAVNDLQDLMYEIVPRLLRIVELTEVENGPPLVEVTLPTEETLQVPIEGELAEIVEELRDLSEEMMEFVGDKSQLITFEMIGEDE